MPDSEALDTGPPGMEVLMLDTEPLDSEPLDTDALGSEPLDAAALPPSRWAAETAPYERPAPYGETTAPAPRTTASPVARSARCHGVTWVTPSRRAP